MYRDRAAGPMIHVPRDCHEIHDPQAVAKFLCRDRALHLYELGDLDPFFAPYTKWFGLHDLRGHLRALALLYSATEPPCLLALGRGDTKDLNELLDAIEAELPHHLYAHLSVNLDRPMIGRRHARHCGKHLKMVLTDRAPRAAHDPQPIVSLAPDDAAELAAFYDRVYPGHWFDPRMLATNLYVGIRERGELVAAAGVHVFNESLGVAALGNIAVDPDRRGHGLGRSVTARLVDVLRTRVTTIGLNVHHANQAAIECYRALGFEVVAEYHEWSFEPSHPIRR